MKLSYRAEEFFPTALLSLPRQISQVSPLLFHLTCQFKGRTCSFKLRREEFKWQQRSSALFYPIEFKQMLTHPSSAWRWRGHPGTLSVQGHYPVRRAGGKDKKEGTIHNETEKVIIMSASSNGWSGVCTGGVERQLRADRQSREGLLSDLVDKAAVILWGPPLWLALLGPSVTHPGTAETGPLKGPGFNSANSTATEWGLKPPERKGVRNY